MEKAIRHEIKNTRLEQAKLDAEGEMRHAHGEKRHWYFYDPVPEASAHSYDSYFKELLDKESVETFEQLLEKRKQTGKSTHVIDFMGPGFFVDLAHVDSLLAVTLADTRTPAVQHAEADKKTVLTTITRASKGIPQIQAVNAFSPGTTFHAIHKYLEQKKIAGFDLFVCRPAGPVESRANQLHKDETTNEYYKYNTAQEMEAYFTLYYRLLQLAYRTLSKDEGMLFTQAPNLIQGGRVEGPGDPAPAVYGYHIDWLLLLLAEELKKVNITAQAHVKQPSTRSC